jgi:hypothetical protein
LIHRVDAAQPAFHVYCEVTRIRGIFHWEDFITVNRIRYISEADIQKKQFVLLVFAGNWFQRPWLPMCNELALLGNCFYVQQPTSS